MTVRQNDASMGSLALPYPSMAGQVVAHRFTYTVPTSIVEGDIIDMAPIPIGCRVVDMILDSQDLDTGTPAILLDVGVMSGAFGETGARTCGAEFFSGSTVAQAGGVARPTLRSAFTVAASASVERSIGVKIATDAATAQAGEIGLTVFYAAAG